MLGKYTFITDTVRDSTKLLNAMAYVVTWHCLPRISFPPFLAAILDFYMKCKNPFISGTVQDRGIVMKFLSPGYVESHLVLFSKNSFSRHFWL